MLRMPLSLSSNSAAIEWFLPEWMMVYAGVWSGSVPRFKEYRRVVSTNETAIRAWSQLSFGPGDSRVGTRSVNTNALLALKRPCQSPSRSSSTHINHAFFSFSTDRKKIERMRMRTRFAPHQRLRDHRVQIQIQIQILNPILPRRIASNAIYHLSKNAITKTMKSISSSTVTSLPNPIVSRLNVTVVWFIG